MAELTPRRENYRSPLIPSHGSFNKRVLSISLPGSIPTLEIER
jgi:hypothetical protein